MGMTIKNTHMKRTMALLAIIICALAFVPASFAQASPNLRVTMLNQEPDPVQPGELLELHFQMENNGGGAVSEAEVELAPEYPFSLRPGDSADQSIGTIGGFARDKEAHKFDYKLLVDERAVEGDHRITVRYHWKGSAWVEQEFTVAVRTRDTHVSIMNIDADELAPGAKEPVHIEVRNYADSAIRDVTLQLDVSSEALPLAIIGTSSEETVGLLRAGETASFDYTIMPYPDAASRIYKVPATLSYYNSQGDKFSKSETLSLIVGAKPDLQVTVDKSAVLKRGDAGEVSLRIANKGTSDVKFLVASVGVSDELVTIGPASKYVGGVDSDDFEIAAFSLFADSATKGKKHATIPLTLDYTDANNNPYTQRIDVALPLYTGSELRRFGLASSSTTPVIILLIIAAGVGYWYWRRRSAKKR